MIAKHYKKKTRKGVETGKKGLEKGSRTGLERGQKQVLNGIKNGISPDSTIWNGVERPFFAVPHLSSLFLPFHPFFHPFLKIFAKKGKKGRQNMEERERKEERSFQFLSRSYFFPFLSSHISSGGALSRMYFQFLLLHHAGPLKISARPIFIKIHGKR